MTESPHPRTASSPAARTRSGRWIAIRVSLVTLAALAAPRSGASAPADSLGAPADSLPPPPAARSQALPLALTGLGFENVSVGPDERAVAFENRRYRHSAEARGRIAAEVHPSITAPVTFFERRLGKVAAAVVDTGGGVPSRVLYPSDREFPAPPAGPVLAPTSHSLDLELLPLFTYELGRLFDPVLVRVEMEPRLRYNLWRGGRATASLIIPFRNDFALDSLHPDINRVRPGPTTLEHFAWVRGVALVSGCAGLFTGNRYGFSMGAARPLKDGAFLLDGQADLTGYIAFPSSGAEYSSLSRWTGFAGVTWRPPVLDLAVRLRGQRFLYADQGGELELRRTMRDLEVAFFVQRSAGFNAHGVRLLIPIPPTVRPTGWRFRPLPVERLPLDYRAETEPTGRQLLGVASREDYLRQLSAPSLASNADRYRANRAEGVRDPVRYSKDRVCFAGTTGFINTPWCDVMSDRSVEVGYTRIPKGAAYDNRGLHRNDLYYAALGFLPRLEVALRWTVIPGLKTYEDLVPDSRLTDSDRSFSGRISLLSPSSRRPGVAIGVDDPVGSRRFHSTYIVAGIPYEYQQLHSRVSLGYAPRVLTASRHTLDGVFGAIEVTPWRPVAAAFEYDTEKWNTSLGVDVGLGLRVRAGLLDGHASVGAGWSAAL
jgi:exopolysaccharide biosynthesis protein YbjH